jgi:enterochelin esterase-like enzyme
MVEVLRGCPPQLRDSALHSTMKRKGFILLFTPIMLVIGTASICAQNTVQDRITTLLPDHRVIFRLSAPQANSVSVLFGSGNPGSPVPVAPMTKDVNGLWSVTLGPFAPDLYEYQFNIDGVIVADPGNNLPKPQRQVSTSLLLIPGDPPDFIDVQSVPHGTIRTETYYSKILGQPRTLLIYVPPGGDRFDFVPLPVLYLYHGYGDTVYSWVTQGRLAEIMDNALAQRKAIPMLVVVPDTEALNPDIVVPADFLKAFSQNAEVEDQELFNDIIPFVNAHYYVRQDSRGHAIAGLSQGGYQTIQSGLVHAEYFSALGVFSAGLFAPLHDVNQALQNPQKINRHIRYFDIVVGSNDSVAGSSAQQFADELSQLHVRHVFELVPGGIHSMDVWRPALYRFVQHIFNDDR